MNTEAQIRTAKAPGVGEVLQSGGQVVVRSRPGRGTEVIPVLPRSKAIPLVGQETAGKEELKVGSERSLAVEGEPDVRRFVVAQLSSLEYETQEAGDGPLALAVLHSARVLDPFLSDVVPPLHMNGLNFAGRRRSKDFRFKAPFCSGHTAQITALADLHQLGATLLLKRHCIPTLATMMRQAI